MVESTALEKRQERKFLEGSNPSLSATSERSKRVREEYVANATCVKEFEKVEHVARSVATREQNYTQLCYHFNMTEEQYLNILISCEPIFEQAANLACDLRNKASSYNKSETGADGIDVVTDADLKVQEFVLLKLAETPLIDCEMIAEESTPTVVKFNGTNGLVISIDPIDGTAMYISGGNFFSFIVGLHNKKDILYSYYRYPLLKWTKRIIRDQAEDIGQIPNIKIKPDIEPLRMVAYLAHVKPDPVPTEIDEAFKTKGLSIRDRKDISDESTMTALLFTDRIAGVCMQNPIAYDCLGILHYARATGGFEIYSTIDLTKPNKGPLGMFYSGSYIVWKK